MKCIAKKNLHDFAETKYQELLLELEDTRQKNSLKLIKSNVSVNFFLRCSVKDEKNSTRK